MSATGHASSALRSSIGASQVGKKNSWAHGAGCHSLLADGMTSTGWVSAGPLSAYFGDSAGLVDLGAVVDGHRCALRGIVVRLATGAAPGVIRFGSDDTQRLVSMQATNPNVNRRENRMLSFDFEGVVEDGDVVDLRPGEERTLVLRLAPFGASSRGSGLKRFSSVPWRTTCRLTLGPNVISFDVSARFCRSLLAIDTKEILFECAVDSSDTRELMVQNFSDIATWFSLRVPSSDCFTFVDCATLSPILPRHPLAGSGQVNVRMIYRPRSSSVGDNTHELVLENCLDERNVERVPIIASVTLESREQGLVLSPDIVDFGDCVSGETIWRTITLKNATRVPLEIFLTSNASGGHKVLFCLEEPTETQQGNNAADPLVASPTASDDDDLGIHIPLGGSAKNLSGSRPLSWAPSTKEGQSGHSRHPSVSLTDFLELSPPPTVSDKVRNLVEELTIPPGKERVLRIFFTGSVSPSVSHSSSGDGNRDDASSADALSGPAFPDYTRLQPLKFHLFLNCRPSNMLGATIHGKYSRVVRCIARLCTSLIAVSTSALNFGEVAVSQSSAMSFNVENLSDIPTTVAVDFESKALSVSRNLIELNPRTSEEVELKLEPCRPSSAYQKEIVVSNLRNPSDTHIIAALSKNVEYSTSQPPRTFFNIATTLSSQCGQQSSGDGPLTLDFGKFVMNFPAARLLCITNATSMPLSIACTGAPNCGVSLYRSVSSSSCGDDIAEDDIGGSLSALVSKEYVDTHGSFSDIDSQRNFVLKETQRLLAFNRSLKDGLIVAADTFDLEPYQTLELLAVYFLRSADYPRIRGKLKNVPTQLTFSLCSTNQSDGCDFPPAVPVVVQVHGMVCHTSMHFALKHINFGVLRKLSRHQFSLVISNMSDVPILYRVAKSGSIASDDLVCSGGDLGVIRPYQIREIPFVFKPSLAGRFLETVTFENVQDSDDKQAIYVKADIKKPFNFWLQTVELDFGYCLVGERSRKRRLLVKNISDRVRRIRIKVDNSQLPPTCSVLFELGEVFLGPATSIDREEEREKLENKLRIAERKGQKEKLKKIRRRLAELRRESSSEFECGDFDGAIDGQGSSNSLLLTLPPNAVQNVFVTFVSQGVSRASSHAALRIEAIRGVILVHEEKNKDYIRDVNFWARVCSDNEIYQRALSGLGISFRSLYSQPHLGSVMHSPPISQHPISPEHSGRASNVIRSASSSPVRRSSLKTTFDHNSSDFLNPSLHPGLRAVGFSIRVPWRFIFDIDEDASVRNSADAFYVANDEWSVRRLLRLPGPRRPSLMSRWALEPPSCRPWLLVNLLGVDSNLDCNVPLRISWSCDQVCGSSPNLSVRLCSMKPDDGDGAVVLRTNGYSADDEMFRVLHANAPITLSFKTVETLGIVLKPCQDEQAMLDNVKPVNGLLRLSVLGETRTIRVHVGHSIPLSVVPECPVLRKGHVTFLVSNPMCYPATILLSSIPGNALHFSQLPSHEISAKGAIRINAEMNSTPCEELSVVLVDTTNMQRKVIPISVASDLVERPLFDFRGVVSMAVDVVHLGPCFVDPITSTFEKVYRLRLTNKSTDTDLSAALSCNLPTQVNFFDSQSCVAELSKVRIPKSASQVVFVRFNLKLDHDYAKQGKCREVRGAFRLSFQQGHLQMTYLRDFSVHLGLPRVTIAVYEPENDSLTYTDDSEYCLDFGTITTSRPCLRGRFAISNPSDLLDFEYRLVFSSSAIRFLEASSVSGVVTCGQSLAFEFEACVSQFGIFEETIALEHVPTHTSVASLRVTCFYDCQALQVQLPFRNRYALLDCSTSYAELSNESTYTVNLYRQVNSCTITNVAPDERTLWLCASIRRGALLVQWASAPGSGTPDDASRIFKQVSYGESATLRIELPHTYAIGQRRWNELASGRPVAFRRRVLVRGRHEDAVLACFAVSGTVAVSLARIDESYVDVGRVGFENGWKDVVVSFTVVNEADIELHYQIKSLCCCFPVAADDVIYSSQTLEPGGRRKHDVVFSPSLVTSEDVVYPSGTFEFHIDVVNLFNSRNENLRLRVLGQLVNCPIQFTHLDSDGCLKLPPVSPYEQSGVSTESFAIVNRDSETSHEIHLDVHTFEEFRDLCSIKVLVGDRSAVNEFVLHAAEQREVRVRIVPSPGYTGRWPTRAGLCSVGSISFLAIGSTKPQVVILQTSFSVDAQFSVSLPRIKFRFTETNESRNFLEDHFWIRNLSSVSPVSIRLSLRSPQPPAWISLLEFSPTHADLAPEASVRVDVYFKSQTGRLVSSPVYIDVIDNSNSLAFKSVEVALVAEALSRTASVPLMTPSDGPVALGEDMVACNREQCISALGIRGAMPVAGSRNRYIINAGQQELGVGDSAFLDWDIVVENQLPGTIEFQLEVINTDCDSADWIRLSKLNGTLHAIHESFTITLSMSTSVQGTFSAYVLLRNSRDIEIQTIRAELVVVKPAALSGKVFEVVVDGGVPCDKGAAPTIDIGDIFLGQSNSNRSFVITNTSSIPIETLVAADLDPNSQACVHFSLTPMALSMFNIITIQPSTSVRVFVHFQTSSSSSPMGIHSFERVAFDIKIGCRIVNDYQASIRYVATCRPPQLQLSTTDINFSGVLSGTLVVSPEEVLVGVSRLYEGVASVSIRTESRFFVVEDASLVASSAPGPKRVTSRLGSGKATFRVCPQLSALASLAGSGVYVEEHFTVYNDALLNERYVVTLRFSTSCQRLFYFSPGSKQGHTFTSIEGRIADFAMRFQSFFHDVGNACPHRALSEWDVASLHDFCVHLLSALSTAEYWDLYSEYFYLTDELVYLSLKCHIGQFVLQLANLLYGFTMRHSALRMAHRICVDTSLQHDPNLSMFVSAWTDRLLYFLCHFPGSSTSLDKYLADLKLPHT